LAFTIIQSERVNAQQFSSQYLYLSTLSALTSGYRITDSALSDGRGQAYISHLSVRPDDYSDIGSELGSAIILSIELVQ
jgi:hypothetical protein